MKMSKLYFKDVLKVCVCVCVHYSLSMFCVNYVSLVMFAL